MLDLVLHGAQFRKSLGTFFQVVMMRHAIDESTSAASLLDQACRGHSDALQRLTCAIFGELRRLAHSRMRSQRNGHVLQTKALVNEAIVRLLDANVLARSPNRRYLFAAASKAMRVILVNHGRRRRLDPRSTIGDPRIRDRFFA